MSDLPSLSLRDAVRIALLPTLSPSQQRDLAERVAGYAGLLPPGEDDVERIAGRLRGRKRRHLAALPSDPVVDQLLADWAARGWSFLRASDPDFPRALHEIPDPPLHLFHRGTAALGSDAGPRVAIVGSRAASSAGLRFARELARDLALARIPVVSGLARGIDAAAHEGALRAGGETLAVLGTGLDRIYPSEHGALAEEIAAQGALVTEFAPGTPPLPLHFPRRNRILVGLAEALIVVEGSERSGARSSVDHALDQGCDVFAVPRDPVHPGSALPNRLLKEGATPITSVRDVLERLDRLGRVGASRPRGTGADALAPGDASGSAAGREGMAAADRAGASTSLEARLLAALVVRPGSSVDALLHQLGDARATEVLGVLTALELEGTARRQGAGGWALTAPIAERSGAPS